MVGGCAFFNTTMFWRHLFFEVVSLFDKKHIFFLSETWYPKPTFCVTTAHHYVLKSNLYPHSRSASKHRPVLRPLLSR